MSDLPPPPLPPDPYAPQPQPPFPSDSLSYQTAPLYGNAPKQLRLAIIFTFIAAGLDGLGSLTMIGIGIFLALVSMGPPNPGDPPQWIFAAVYVPWGLVVLCFGIVKLIAGLKLKRVRPGARGWGIAAGIIGAAQFFCGSCCWVQPGFGVYTLVVLSSQTMLAYFAYLEAENRSPLD